MADALNATKGWPARADELWIAYASKVFPVPVSPRSTTGTSDLAARAASCKQRAMASLLVVRSSILSLESGSCIAARGLLPHALSQLPNGLKRIINERPSPDNDARFPLHPDAQRQSLPGAWRNFVAVQ